MSRVLLMVRGDHGPDECWPWPKARSRGGYGRTHVYIDGARYSRNAHRVAWMEANGPIPPKMHVCHRCDNRLCCNPAHLFLGTNAENTADRHAKRRDACGVRNTKTKLSEADVREIHLMRAHGCSGPAIASRFGVNNTTIYRVLSGRYHGRILASGGSK